MVGGLEGINKAIECKNTATCEYSSGLQVSGVFTEVADGCATASRFICARPGRRRSPSTTRNCRDMAAIITRTASVRRLGIGRKRELREGEAAKLEFESG